MVQHNHQHMRLAHSTSENLTSKQSGVVVERTMPAGWWWMIPLIAISGILTFSSGIHGVFLFDDIEEIGENANIRQLWPLSTPLFKPNYLPVRPIPYLTFALNYAVHQQAVEGYHYVNISIHLVTGIVLYWIIWKTLSLPDFKKLFTHPEILSLASVLIWLVHPLQTQAVNYIYQRMELLMSMFFVLTWGSLILAVGTKHTKWQLSYYILSIVFCILGTLSKEVMVVVPIFILWYDRLFLAKSWSEIKIERWWYYVSLFGCWLILGILINSQVEFYPEHYRPMPGRFEYLMTQSEVITHYLKLVFDPRELCFEYGWPISKNFYVVWKPFCFISALFLMTIYFMIKYPAWGFIGGSFFLFLGPTSSINPVLAPAFEHRMYLSLFALTTILLLSFNQIMQKISVSRTLQKNVILLQTALIVFTLAYLSHERCKLYANFETIWQDTLNKAPHNYIPYYMLGHYYDEQGDPEKALPYCKRAVELDPSDPDSINNYGLCLLELNQLDEALKVLKKNLESHPTHIDTLNNLGTVYGMRNELYLAEKCFAQVIKLNPEQIGAKINLARLDLIKANYQNVETLLGEIFRVEPANFQAIVLQADFYLSQNKSPQAKKIIDYLIINYPDHPETIRLRSQIP